MLGRVEGAQYGLIHFFAVLTFILAGIIARIRTGPLTPRPPEEWSAPLSSDGAAGARAHAQELSPASLGPSQVPRRAADGPADTRPRAADIAFIRTGPLKPRPQSPEEWRALLSSDGAADARARAQELSPASRALFSSDGPADARPRAADGVEIPSTINHWNADEGVDAPLHFCGDNETEWDDPAIVCDEEFLECGGKFFP